MTITDSLSHSHPHRPERSSMSSTKRFIPVTALVGITFVSILLAMIFPEESQFPLFGVFFIIGLLLWVVWMGGGWRMAEKDVVLIVEDFTGHVREVRQGTYLYIPIIHTIEAKMPSYPLRHEFEVDSIDTRTPRLLQIKKINVRVAYEIGNFASCFARSSDVKERIKELEANSRQHRDDPALWTRVLNEVMCEVIDDAIRDGVWKWADAIVTEPGLKLNMPSLSEPPKDEHTPYALSLNRLSLAEKVLEEVKFRAQRWGLQVNRIVFENIVLDPEIVKRSTRSKERELAEATHEAQKTAIAIREKGMAEAEVRAETVSKIIAILVNQKGINVTDQMLYTIVRAAMYSDSEMIWRGMMEKGAGSSVKTA
jgi:hypothetical protein